jgi:transcriptional repressor NrdR
VSREALEKLVDDVEESIGRRVRDEIPTSEIGNEIIKHLGGLDQVAYVRFASVYREFKDVTQFLDELRSLLEKKR